MLPTPIQLNLSKVTLKSLKADEEAEQDDDRNTVSTLQNHTSNNEDIIITSGGGESIITISSTCDQYDDLKSPKSPKQATGTTATRIVHFLTKQPISPISAAQEDECSNIAVETIPRRLCCKLTDFISSQENIADVYHRKGRRIHGLQLPLHPLQIFGWIVLVLFGVAAYILLIPAFVQEIQEPLYGLITGLYIVHIVSHLTALLLDPADRELRRVHRNDRIVPEFDRTKHAHVIENGRCHLCNIRTTSTRTKHCSVCNKCVGKFDHHCKWLNHCIGSRNYVAFLMCVVSAVIATLVIVAAVIAQIAFYYFQPEWLNVWYASNATIINGTDPAPAEDGTIAYVVNPDFIKNSTTFHQSSTESTIWDISNVSSLSFDDADYTATLPVALDNITASIVDSLNQTFERNITTASADETDEETLGAVPVLKANDTLASINGSSISDTLFLILIGCLGLLAAITAGLLLHLCFFHIYISFLGLTTYEYIRNHRQAQDAKAKSLISTLPNQQPISNSSPSKQVNDPKQIYFCASLQHPNSPQNEPQNELRYFEAYRTQSPDDDRRCSRIHCCTDSREYNQTAVKTYYMCSLLEEQPPLSIAHISGTSEESDMEHGFRTFHCCSSFAATTTQRKVSVAGTKATLVSADPAASVSASSRRAAHSQFAEQCTFCTFRIRSPIVRKRNVPSPTAASSGRSSRTPSAAASNANATGQLTSEHQRCCMKSISKHQRWRKKWNCCSSVPDSPDVPNDIIAALAIRSSQQQQSASASASSNKINATEIPVQFIKTVNGGEACGEAIPSQRSSAIRNNARTWPVSRFRHMLRMLHRQRRRPHPICRHHGAQNESQTKQNQIRPLQLQASNESNGVCHHHHHHNHHHHYNQFQNQTKEQYCYYDDRDRDSSPQPPSTPTTTTTERSSEPSLYSDSSAMTTPISAHPCNAIETILPTSVIRDDTSVTYTITLPPALPPPTRRKMPNPTDMEELAESLGFSSTLHHHHPHQHHQQSPLTPAGGQRLPALNNVYRRQRRKHFLRTRSPTLSPIHESGLSNPTSPQPCRHSVNGAAAAAGSMNNVCGSSETVRKTSSNSSLHSVSSNSSGT